MAPSLDRFCGGGGSRGTLVLAIRFTTNRTGFVVPHSLGVARGRRVEIVHPDGAKEASTFPTLVSRHQPFFDIAAMSYESAAGAEVRLRFEREIFETEDQRNWTDASYKTYCRPLRLPYPYRIEPGAQVRQGLCVELRPSPRRASVPRRHALGRGR
jgi:hypothetical protein